MFVVLDGRLFTADQIETFWEELDTKEIWKEIQCGLKHRLFGVPYFVSPAIKFEGSFGFFTIFSDYLTFCHVIDDDAFDLYFALSPNYPLCATGSQIAFVYRNEEDLCVSIKSYSVLPCVIEFNPERALFFWAHHRSSLEEMFIPWISNNSIKGLLFFSRHRKNYKCSQIKISKFIRTEKGGYKYEVTYFGSVPCTNYIYAPPKGNIIINDKTITMVGTAGDYRFCVPYIPGEYVYESHSVFDVILAGDDLSSVYMISESPLKFRPARFVPYIEPKELVRFYNGASIILSADKMRFRRSGISQGINFVKFKKYARIKLAKRTLRECKTHYESIPPVMVRQMVF